MIPLLPIERRGLYLGEFLLPSVMGVTYQMRHMDRWETYALRASNDSDDLIQLYLQMRQAELFFAVVREKEFGAAVATFGVWQKGPGVGSAHMIATPSLTPRTAGRLARFVKNELVPEMNRARLHRVDCAVLAQHHEAQHFLAACGAEPEGVRRQLGKGREDFIEFAWINEKETQLCA